jgi:hypothetical protein
MGRRKSIKQSVKRAKDLESLQLLTANEVAGLIRRSPASLARDRCNGVGIPYIKYGHKVFYRYDDVLRYVEGCRIIHNVKQQIGLVT